MKLRRCALMLVVPLFFLSACGRQPTPPAAEEKQPVEILLCRWNNMDQNNEIMNDIIADFQAQHEGEITLRVEVVPGLENLINHVRIKIAAGQIPDLIDTSGYEISYLVKDTDKIADLMPYVEADPELRAWIGEENLRDNVADGKLSSITAQKNVIGYWYNKELFARAGIEPAETWEDFWSNCDVLKAHSIWPMALDTRQSAWPSNILLGAMVGSQGGACTQFMQIYRPTDYNFPEMVDSLEALQTCFQEYAPPSAPTANYVTAANEFFSGNAAMLFNGAWLALDLSDPEVVSPGFAPKVGAAIYPNSTVYMSASPGYVVGNNAPEKVAAAVEFIKYMVSPEVQERIAVEIKAVPVNPELDLSVRLEEENPLMYDMLTAAAQADIKLKDYQAMWYPTVYNACKTLYPQLIYEKITPETVAAEMTALAESAEGAAGKEKSK